MRYGFCTDIATKTRGEVEYDLLKRVKEAGFDYVEFPLMMIETLTEEAFEKLISESKRLDLPCDVCCNFFPGRIKVVGPAADKAEIDAYLDRAMSRAERMGVKKVVFGSCPSRNLPDGMNEEEGYGQLHRMLNESVVPFCRKYGIIVVIEPIRRQAANFVITLQDGRKVVDMANKPEILLLADLMHMNYNEEDPGGIRSVAGIISHVHLCELDRLLPEENYSEYLEACLDVLRDCGYDGTISFESKDETASGGMKKALELLKTKFK